MLFSCGGSRTTPRAARTTLVVSRSMSRPVWEREIHSERLRLRERPQVRAGGQRRKYATADARRRDATPDSRSLVSRATASIRTSITTRRTRALTGKDQLQERSEEERRDGRGGGTQTRRDNSKIWRPLTGAGLREGEELAGVRGIEPDSAATAPAAAPPRVISHAAARLATVRHRPASATRARAREAPGRAEAGAELKPPNEAKRPDSTEPNVKSNTNSKK